MNCLVLKIVSQHSQLESGLIDLQLDSWTCERFKSFIVIDQVMLVKPRRMIFGIWTLIRRTSSSGTSARPEQANNEWCEHFWTSLLYAFFNSLYRGRKCGWQTQITRVALFTYLGKLRKCECRLVFLQVGLTATLGFQDLRLLMVRVVNIGNVQLAYNWYM